jgi:hypothetical protein
LCYTNTAKVRLFLNGNQVGDEQAYDRETGVISSDISYQAGALEAVGFDERGHEICRTRIQTSEAAAAMTPSADEAVLDCNRGVAMVTLQIVDRHGVPVMDATHEVTCVVEGPARLLGLEAGNSRDMSNTSDAVRQVFHGRMVAYVQATGAEGEVRVRFSTAGLPESVQTLAARAMGERR